MKKIKKEFWDDRSSNKEQQYLTHGAFRYFGKLPPTLTRKILTIQGVGVGSNKRYVELMCGSGTGIIEAMIMGASATGVDCNPLALLATRVKTTPVSTKQIAELIEQFESASRSNKILPHKPEPDIRNFDKWFSTSAKCGLCALRDWINTKPPGNTVDIYWLAFASAIRACSNASVRTGRLFYDCDKTPPLPIDEFRKKLLKICDAIALLNSSSLKSVHPPIVRMADARSSGLPASHFHNGLCHPPYFALYRYSSDVLRFELDWLGYSRKEVASKEIEDGFKTTDATLVQAHIKDMVDVAVEARRIIVKGGTFAIVTADSTLRKERLDIINPLINGALQNGWCLEKHAIRKVRYAQASYHRSADPTIQRPEDEVMLFRAV